MNRRMIRKQARELIKAAQLEPGYDYQDDDGNHCRSVFLGTVLIIMPSGKFYTPWAYSNVDACPRCKWEGCAYCGDLGSREAYEDQVMSESLEEYASKAGGWIEPGEGDPCDLFFVTIVESGEDTE